MLRVEVFSEELVKRSATSYIGTSRLAQWQLSKPIALSHDIYIYVVSVVGGYTDYYSARRANLGPGLANNSLGG